MCIYYWALNKVTIKNNYMLSMVNDLLQKLDFFKRVLNIEASKKIHE